VCGTRFAHSIALNLHLVNEHYADRLINDHGLDPASGMCPICDRNVPADLLLAHVAYNHYVIEKLVKQRGACCSHGCQMSKSQSLFKIQSGSNM
jgi:hypothetical protein